MIKEKKNSKGKALCMGEAYKLTGLSKIKGIKTYIMNLLSNEHKFILFAHHRIVLDSIEEFLQKKHVMFIRIDGDTDIQRRFKLVEQFQTNKQCLVALLSINATATGITLTSAAMVVFAELSWTPSIMIQAEDRAHRIGQKNDTVDVRYLYGRDTLDEYIFRKLSEKMTIVSTTLDNVVADMGLKDTDEENDSESEFESDESQSKAEAESELTEDFETASTEIDLNDLNVHEHSMKRKRIEIQNEKDDDDNVIRSKRYIVRMYIYIYIYILYIICTFNYINVFKCKLIKSL
jgi:superfamily II DNA or RNA helicase